MNTVILELPFDALALPGCTPESLASAAKFMLVAHCSPFGDCSDEDVCDSRNVGENTRRIGPAKVGYWEVIE